jgi:bis(5'-nucleosyl)-tetraphosphatase (symmetrical)
MGEGEGVVSVLGNHDLHLLRAAAGLREPHRRDTMDEILEAPDREPLLDWLRRRPFVHVEGKSLLVHAGLWPGWDVPEALALSTAAQMSMASSDELLAALGDFRLDDAASALASPARLRAGVVLMTTVRMLGPGGEPLRFAGSLDQAPAGAVPWFEAPGRRWTGVRVFFGHWAALGARVMPEAVALDSGAVWGRALTAYRLDDDTLFTEPARDGVSED